MYDFTLVDAHVHPFLNGNRNICQYTSTPTPEDMVAKLKECGITLCCGSTIAPGAWLTRWQDVADCNKECFEFAEKFPDFLIPGLLIHATFVNESCAEVEKYFATGKLHWIGEIVPYNAGTMDYAVSTLFPVYELLVSLNLPINLHPNGLSDIEKIVKNFPKLNVVMAHPAEKAAYMEKLALMKKYPNLHLDLSGTGIFRWGMLTHGVNEVGAERFIHGSDFPICNPAMYSAAIKAEALSEKDTQLILSGNFRRLTGL